MASASLIDYYNSRGNLEKLNPLIRSVYNNTFDFDEYKQKLLAKVEVPNQDGSVPSLLDSIESLRREQRVRLEQTERDYYTQKKSIAFDVPFYPQEESQRETIVTSKPPVSIPTRRVPSPVIVTEEHIHYHHPIPSYDDDEIAFRPHRLPIHHSTSTIHDTSTSHVQSHIEDMWNELELEDYMEEKKIRRPPSAPTKSSWAGRVTRPQPFALTNSTTMGHVHRKNCVHQIEEAKLQKEIEEDLMLSRSFKANPVPAHVRMPLYEQLQDEQRARREQVRHMTKEYLHSITKPFEFDAREKAKDLSRRHSYSDSISARRQSHFKAKPLPEFYYRTSKDIENMKENSLYRTIKKEVRAKELLRQSRLPSSMQERQEQMHDLRRSMSANDLSQTGLDQCTFQPKTNGYYIPDYDKLHSKFLRQSEQMKRFRTPTKCEPFVLHTSFIPSRQDQVLDDIRYDEEMRYLQTFQIKGKQLPIRSKSGMDLSSTLQKSEAIPTKTTEAQRVREVMGKKKRREAEVRTEFEHKFQRSRSAKGKRLRENIHERAKLNDKSAVYKAKKEESNRRIRQTLYRKEDDYARRLDEIQQRVDQRPLMLEQQQRDRAARDLERNIQHAMRVAKITEKDLMRQKFNPPNVKVTTVRANYSS